MKSLLSRSPSNTCRAEGSERDAQRIGPRALIGAVSAILLLGLVATHGRPTSASGGDETTSGQTADMADGFAAEIKRALKSYDVRLVTLARAVLDDPSGSGGFEEQFERLRIDAMKAESDYQYASQKREIAEIEFTQFTEATLPRELVAADMELEVARADLTRAQELTQQATGKLEKLTSQLELHKARIGLELAETHKKVLVEYTKSSRTRELASQLARARSEEHGKKAEWELLKRRMEKLRETGATVPRPGDVEQRILALIVRAIPIEERVRAGQARASGRAKISESDQKELRDLTNELGAVVDDAEAVKAEDDFGRLKLRVQQAARRHRGPDSK